MSRATDFEGEPTSTIAKRFALAGGIWAVALGVTCCGLAAPFALAFLASLSTGAIAGIAAGAIALGAALAALWLARRRRACPKSPAAVDTATRAPSLDGIGS